MGLYNHLTTLPKIVLDITKDLLYNKNKQSQHRCGKDWPT